MSAVTTGFAFRVRSGMASGYLVAAHVTVKMNLCLDFVFGNGPTQSMITSLNGLPITRFSCKGAKETV